MFKKIILSVSVLFALTGLVLISTTVNAAPLDGTGTGVGKAITSANSSITGEGGIVNVINNVINWASAIIAAIAVAFIVYGSFVWITSGQENGQKIVIQAVVGLIVLVVSYFIAQIAVSLATTAQGQINKP
jgi:Type IV secretion system pilin